MNLNIQEFLKKYREMTLISQGDGFAIVGLPFFHLEHPDGIALRFSIKDGFLTLSDCHTTTDYLDERGIDLNDYFDKLTTIMRKFDITLDGNVFRKIIPNADNDIDLCRGVSYFIEALSIISHIDL